MRLVYLVVGTTGEYSDREEWPVRAYLLEANAVRHRDAAEAAAATIHREREDRYSVPHGVNPHDPDMKMDYTGTHYEIWMAELGDE